MECDERPAQRVAQAATLLQPRPFLLDILVRTPEEIRQRLEIGDYFIQEVMERGKVLYERDIPKRLDSKGRRGLSSCFSFVSPTQKAYTQW